MLARPISARRVANRLSKSDPVLARIIRRTGPRALPRLRASFASLATTIVNQQISGKAGEAILRRVKRLYGGRGFPPPSWFRVVPEPDLRNAGVSPQKASYLRDLAQHVTSGRLDFRKLPQLSDDEVVQTLTSVKGIGVWTAQMCLIFSLNRPDILPTGDLGIRKAVGRAWNFKSVPAERTVEQIGRRWAPYRSHASFYLWLSLSNPLRAKD